MFILQVTLFSSQTARIDLKEVDYYYHHSKEVLTEASRNMAVVSDACLLDITRYLNFGYGSGSTDYISIEVEGS